MACTLITLLLLTTYATLVVTAMATSVTGQMHTLQNKLFLVTDPIYLQPKGRTLNNISVGVGRGRGLDAKCLARHVKKKSK